MPASVLASCSYNAARPVNYVAGRDAGRPEASRGRYRVAESAMTITGPRKKDPSYTLRRVFVHSSANADAAGRARTRKLEQAADDLDRLTRGLGSRHYPDAAKVPARINAITAGRRAGDYLRAQQAKEQPQFPGVRVGVTGEPLRGCAGPPGKAFQGRIDPVACRRRALTAWASPRA